MIWHSSHLLRFACLLVVMASLLGVSHPLEAGDAWQLPHGQFPVGFRSQIVLDQSRVYRTTFDDGTIYGGSGKRPRPILVNVWYPASVGENSIAMPYRGYFELHSTDPEIQRWANALSAYAANVVAQEFFGKPVSELDDVETQFWQRFLDEPTTCHVDAPPVAGKFPTVIYHSGAGSSYEDNTPCFEYLASCGYVVIGSAYPKADGSEFNIDAQDGSVRDMEFLSRYAAGLAFADWNRLAYAGHSAGAQVCFRAQCRPDCPADVLISIDTTVDYYSLRIPTFQYLIEPVLENVERFNKPLLVLAGPEAAFLMCDRLVNGERTYLTVPEVGHNEFIAQGVQRLQVLEGLAAARPTEELTREIERTDAVRGYYTELCVVIRQYLDVRLKSNTGNSDAVAGYAQNRLGEAKLVARVVDVGHDGPEPYDLEGNVPPTPRQVRPLLNRVSVSHFCEILERYKSQDPRSPIYQSNMLMGSILYDLVEEDRVPDAQALNTYAQGISIDGISTLRFLAFMSQLTKRPERARHFLNVALAIDPDDAETQKKLQELDGAKQSPQ